MACHIKFLVLVVDDQWMPSKACLMPGPRSNMAESEQVVRACTASLGRFLSFRCCRRGCGRGRGTTSSLASGSEIVNEMWSCLWFAVKDEDQALLQHQMTSIRLRLLLSSLTWQQQCSKVHIAASMCPIAMKDDQPWQRTEGVSLTRGIALAVL